MNNSIKKLIKECVKIVISEGHDDIDWDLYEIMDEEKMNIINAYINAVKKEKPSEDKPLKARQKWEVIPFYTVKKVWEDFIKNGNVISQDIPMLNKIEDLITRNICRLHVNTELAGHTDYGPDPKSVYKEHNENITDEFAEYLDEHFGDYILDTGGHWRISDYGLKPLETKLSELRKEKNPEKKLAKIDQIFNVIHQRSDLAALFIEGGSSSYDKLSGLETKEDDDKQQTVLREYIRRTLLEMDNASPVKDVFADFEAALGDDAKNLDNITKMSQQDIKNQETKIKSDSQTKNKLNTNNPERKGLEVSLPLQQKELDLKTKNLDNLTKAKVGLTNAQKKIEDQKKKLELDKKASELKQKQQIQGSNIKSTPAAISSVLPSLESPI